MPHWMLKSMAQGAISLLPKSQFWNSLFQQYVTKSFDLNNGQFDGKLLQCRKHLDNYFSTSPIKKTSFSVVELGTGGYPIVPIGLYLCGASKVWSIDKVSLFSPTMVRKVLHLFVEYDEKGILLEKLPVVHKDRIFVIKNTLDDKSKLSSNEILGRFNISAMQCDARNTRLEVSSVDLFVSNNTLEHIPDDIIYGIFIEFKRIASPLAVMSHFIDIKDHYARFDPSITSYNFLKYSDTLWMLFNNSLQYQNRLRIPDYRRIHQTSGWKIQIEQNTQGSIGDLQNIRIARRFQYFSQNELLILASWITSLNE